MDDVLGVRVEQASCNLLDDDFNGFKREFVLLFENVGERNSLDVGHRDEQLSVLFSEIEHMDNVLVVHLLHGLGFEVETLDGFVVGGLVQNLERDFAFQLFVERLIDAAHAALAERVEDVVVLVERTGCLSVLCRCFHFALLE